MNEILLFRDSEKLCSYDCVCTDVQSVDECDYNSKQILGYIFKNFYNQHGLKTSTGLINIKIIN